MTDITTSRSGSFNGPHGTIMPEPSNQEVFGATYEPSMRLRPGEDLFAEDQEHPDDPHDDLRAP